MPNHYHLLVETPEPNLVTGMKWLQGTYTRRYNLRHRLAGHLFQGRYRAVPIEAEEAPYLGVASTYIHLNPVRAGLAHPGEDWLGSYRWSSCPEFMLPTDRRRPWIETSRVLQGLEIQTDALAGAEGLAAYLKRQALHLATAAGRLELEELWQPLRHGWCIGGKAFRDQLLGKVGQAISGRRRDSYQDEAVRAHDENAAQEKLDAALAILGLDIEDLRKLPKGAPEKQALAWWLRERTTVSRRWLSERLRMGHESRVTQAVAAVKRASAGALLSLREQLQQVSDEQRRAAPAEPEPEVPPFLD
jgi:hypothetical protein